MPKNNNKIEGIDFSIGYLLLCCYYV